MCLACSQFCGRCITPTLKSISCTHCNTNNVLTRDECIVYLGYRKPGKNIVLEHGLDTPACENCGSDLTDDIKEAVIPLDCLYAQILCGFPCGRHVRTRRVGDSICAKQTPIGKLTSVPKSELSPWYRKKRAVKATSPTSR